MAELPAYIVDASVVARWYMRNPPYLEQALQIQTDYAQRRIRLLAPDNLRYEVAGAIRRAVTARFFNVADGRALLSGFLDWPIRLVQGADLILPAYDLSTRLGCSFYDAIYLTLAQRENVPFVHADQRLHNALGGRFPLAIWIEDYQPAR